MNEGEDQPVKRKKTNEDEEEEEMEEEGESFEGVRRKHLVVVRL